mmetsp:Transcript_76176/g.176708  ORF Transcript_76176/g.176708 Transcript_76176/m.176708 type:complete len:322 (-) Transcript_76176:252-1217(-)
MVTAQAVDLAGFHRQERGRVAYASMVTSNDPHDKVFAGLYMFAGAKDLHLDVPLLVAAPPVSHYVALDHATGLADLLDGLAMQTQQVALLSCGDLNDSLLLWAIGLKHAELTAALDSCRQAACIAYQRRDERLQRFHEVPRRTGCKTTQLSGGTRDTWAGCHCRYNCRIAQHGIEFAARRSDEAVDERHCVVHSVRLPSNKKPWRVIRALGAILLDLYVASGDLSHLLHSGALVAHALANHTWFYVHIGCQVPQLCLVTRADGLQDAGAMRDLLCGARHFDRDRGLHLGLLLVVNVETGDPRHLLHFLDRQALEAKQLPKL